MDKTASSPQKAFLINRNYARLWVGQSISYLGDQVFDTTLVLWIATIIAHNQPWAPLAVSGVLVAAGLPIFLVGPVAGVFVDHWNKRQTMLRMDAIRAVLIVLLLLSALPLPFLPGGQLPSFAQLGLIYLVVFLASACSQFFGPARMAMIGDVVDEPDRARAGSLAQISINLAIILGPPLAAPLLFTVGAQWALLLNALSFVASFLAILGVRVPKRAQQADQEASQSSTFLGDLGAGLRFFATNRFLVTLLVTIIIVTFGNGALNALDIFFVTQNLHVPSNLYGFLGTALGAGAVLGAILSTVTTPRIGVVRNFWGCLLLDGLLLILFARMTSFLPALILFFCLGFPVAALNASIMPLLLHVTPRKFLGRVSAVINPVQSLVSMLSIVLAGWLASTVLNHFHQRVLGLIFGPIDTIFVASGLLFLLGGIYALVNLRGINLEANPAQTNEATVSASVLERN